ncbi:MAG TPA: hypothetical protein PLD59_12095, partial [Tepidisphaeraceae bacterium]|nr:hypothetical protein [Tepidisphaeraceae bacterium]
MIELICIKCEGAMQVDDAFAGSSCRCRQCGTIQTVPKLRRNAEPARATKSLYTNLKRTGQSSSGLEALADVVASSGLSSGLPPSDDLPATTQRPSRRPIITAVVGGIVGVIATVAIMIALTRSGQTASKAVDARPAMPNPAAGRLMYCGIDIDAPVVIFVLDRGNSTRDAMGHLVNATAAAIRRLGSDRKFQVVFWDNGQSEVSYPPGGPQYATPEAVNGAIRVMDGVVAFGRTEAGSAVEKALVS